MTANKSHPGVSHRLLAKVKNAYGKDNALGFKLVQLFGLSGQMRAILNDIIEIDA